MNKLVIIFFIVFVILEALVYYIYKNKQIIKESFVESYQGSDVNYESCIKSGYPQTWCLSIQDPYSIVNPDSTLDKCVGKSINKNKK